MEQINELIPQSIATLAHPTPAAAANTPEWVAPKFNWHFETFGEPMLEGMLREAIRFCDDMSAGKRPRWLSLLGSSGAGKTHLAKRICAAFRMGPGWFVEPRTGATLIRPGGFASWRMTVNDLRNGNYGRFRDLCDFWFIGLDDIGVEQKTDFITSKLDELCDARLDKWTVLTGNLSLEQIHDRLSARIASRLLRNGSVVVDVDVPDFSLRAGSIPSKQQ